MIWTEKYRPKKFDDVKGQEETLQKVKSFIENFGKKKKAIILCGAPGTGKTSIAQVVANEMNSEIFELNASDLRNKSKLNEVLRPSIEQMSLQNKSKIILVDEADGISEYDYGGISELIKIIEDTNYPMIITANDIWGKKFSDLRKKCEVVQVDEMATEIIYGILENILKEEGVIVEEELIREIAVKSRGDLRAAINDAQTFSQIKDSVPIIVDERNKEMSIFNALKKIFKEKPSNEMMGLFDSVNMPIDEIILWVEENIPAEYSGKELARAYELLAKTDIFKGRIYKQQYWRFLIYENIFLSYGISSSKKNSKAGFTSYKRPSRILQIWLNNQKTMKKKSICEKYATQVHIGTKRAMSDFPVIKLIIRSNPKIQKELKLSEEEIDYVMQ